MKKLILLTLVILITISAQVSAQYGLVEVNAKGHVRGTVEYNVDLKSRYEDMGTNHSLIHQALSDELDKDPCLEKGVRAVVDAYPHVGYHKAWRDLTDGKEVVIFFILNKEKYFIAVRGKEEEVVLLLRSRGYMSDMYIKRKPPE
jgi:hypothetical protein